MPVFGYVIAGFVLQLNRADATEGPSVEFVLLLEV
jgi:hypothetical protein